MDRDKTFHLGLCMAGSISAGAYTAGVIDYLFEALNNWEAKKNKGDASVPDHDVLIDVFGGSSGGGITAAIALFAQQEKISPMRLENNRPTNDGGYNLLYDTWVQMTGSNDVFAEMLDPSDVKMEYVPALMNSGFIDTIAGYFKDYLYKYKGQPFSTKSYINDRAELFLTLFNITGIKYQLLAKSGAEGVIRQYATEHRDMAHFRIARQYENDGRMPLDFSNTDIIDILIDSAMATGAFPIGLSSRFVSRPKRFIWDNPYINKNGRFTWDKIKLDVEGHDTNREVDGKEIYKSLNSDGGVANNEPIEIARHILQGIRKDMYGSAYENCDNTSVILIDPFPSFNTYIEKPGVAHQHLMRFTTDVVMAMQSQLLFDAKTMLDAYNDANNGLYLVAPSKDGYKPEHAIACGSLGGFGGFLAADFRIHDFFLGRHNCQSFLRKYFVINLEETEEKKMDVSAIVNGYSNPDTIKRYGRKREGKGVWVPIIPDMQIQQPDDASDKKFDLPLYYFERLSETALNHYFVMFERRFSALAGNLKKTNGIAEMALAMGIKTFEDNIADSVLNYIKNDFKKRKLMQK
ncbi:MAG TPA: patatin-like phospholipase family protein [Chitinophagaceae bacterium]